VADLERIKRDIAEIAEHPKSVTLSKITRIADQLKMIGWEVSYRKTNETWVFYIQGEAFNICDHHRGSSQLKQVYVRKFLGAMINLRLHEG